MRVALISYPTILWDSVSANIGNPGSGRLSAYTILAMLTESWETEEHLAFSFFVEAPDFYFSGRDFSVTTVGKGYLVSGSLAAFHRWLLDTLLTKAKQSLERRMVANAILVTFEDVGLKPVFNRYKKKAVNDGTFTLEHT